MATAFAAQDSICRLIASEEGAISITSTIFLNDRRLVHLNESGGSDQYTIQSSTIVAKTDLHQDLIRS
jgi:hypothetical protein